MLRVNAVVPYQGKIETLELIGRDPFMSGLGFYEDVNGKTWDIKMVVNNDKFRYVCARQVNSNMPYYSTCPWGHSFGSHEWVPYFVKIKIKKGIQ
jgi:hypothetical protein